MKFLVDECVGSSVAQWLKQNDYDVAYVGEDLAGITDAEVLKKALEEPRVLITSDKDFGELIFRKKESHFGLILLRLVDEHLQNKIKILTWVLEHYASQYALFVEAS